MTVRDADRLRVATRGVDVIVHAAALKQVESCEYNPFEAVQTNVLGAQNVASAAIENEVPLTMALSTDKAVNPVNLYGATKLAAEKIISQADVYAPDGPARFGSVRYGNVVGSRGSVIPVFKQQAETGVLSITDDRMTRFWITLRAGRPVRAQLDGARARRRDVRAQDPEHEDHRPGARPCAPEAEYRITGIRPGEKLHEVMVTEDEARVAYDIGDRYVIMPSRPTWHSEPPERGKPLPDGFRYSSDNNTEWLTEEQLLRDDQGRPRAGPPRERPGRRRPGWEA